MSAAVKIQLWSLVLGAGLTWLSACQAPGSGRASARRESLVTCSSSSDPCDDGELCTQDECLVANNICQNRFIAGCCVSATDCDDGSECTENLCLSNVCTFRAILGCVPSLDSGPADAGGDAALSDAASDAQTTDAASESDAAASDAQTTDAQ
ncbi:MAG: hypothetical protein GXP55_07825, partial [Deltaproteobacteria bacterium]|nr:hypothetical protein [Deltaproteobacteria bacterium]